MVSKLVDDLQRDASDEELIHNQDLLHDED
jgi:hypothetical protein